MRHAFSTACPSRSAIWRCRATSRSPYAPGNRELRKRNPSCRPLTANGQVMLDRTPSRRRRRVLSLFGFARE